jgi:hypothetical protein
MLGFLTLIANKIANIIRLISHSPDKNPISNVFIKNVVPKTNIKNEK